MGMLDWTDSRIKMLRQLIEAGASCGEAAAAINAETGASFSRNAVIGKVTRLGLVSPNKPRQRTVVKTRKPKRDPAIKLRRPVPAHTPRLPAAKAAPAPQDVTQARPFKVRELYGTALSDDERWVRQMLGAEAKERCAYDEACTAPPIRGRFYCEAHCQIVYRPASQPKNPLKPHHRPTRR